MLFDVADPLRPHLVCTAINASVRFVSRDEIAYITAYSPGSMQVYRLRVGGTPTAGITLNSDGYLRDWRPDGTFAYTHNVPGPSADCCGVDQLHIVSAGVDRLVCSRRVGIVGIGGARFYPFQLDSFSLDGGYYAQTTFAGKGGETCDLIARAADGSVVAPLAGGVTDGVWSNVTNRLYYVTAGEVDTWDPAGGATKLLGDAWIAPRIGPGGTRVAYTYYLNKGFAEGDIRVGIFDLPAGKAVGGLPNKPRSEAAFVTPTLLWYLEEGPCNIPNGCFTGDTSPTGRVLAFDTLTGAETPVSFAPGESPVALDDYQAFNVQLPPA